MRRFARIGWFGLLAVAVSAQTRCVLEGVVIDGVTGRPLDKARVFAHADADVISELPVRRLTDTNGRFCFERLQAGAYTVDAKRTGYLGANYGEKRPGGVGLALEIADKPAENIAIRMTAEAVLSGRVLDADGDPISGAFADLMKRGWSNGKVDATDFQNSQTSEEGYFRFSGLAPGTS